MNNEREKRLLVIEKHLKTFDLISDIFSLIFTVLFCLVLTVAILVINCSIGMKLFGLIFFPTVMIIEVIVFIRGRKK